MEFKKFMTRAQEPDLPTYLADEGGGEWNPKYEEVEEEKMISRMFGKTLDVYGSMTFEQQAVYTSMNGENREAFIKWTPEERAAYAEMYEKMVNFFNMQSFEKQAFMAGRRVGLISVAVGTEDLEEQIRMDEMEEEARRSRSSTQGSFNAGPQEQTALNEHGRDRHVDSRNESPLPNQPMQRFHHSRERGHNTQNEHSRHRSRSTSYDQKRLIERRVRSDEYDSSPRQGRHRSPSPCYNNHKDYDNGRRNNSSSGDRSPNRSSYNRENVRQYQNDRNGESSRNEYINDRQDSYGWRYQNRGEHVDDRQSYRGETSPPRRSRRDSHEVNAPRWCDHPQNGNDYDNNRYRQDRSGSRNQRGQYVNKEQRSPSPRPEENMNFLKMSEVFEIIANVKKIIVETATSRIMEALEKKSSGSEGSFEKSVSKFAGTSLGEESRSSNSSSSDMSPTPGSGGFRPFPAGDRSWPPACLTGERLQEHEEGMDRGNDCLFCGGYHYVQGCPAVPTAEERCELYAEQGRCYRCRGANHLAKNCRCINRVHLNLCRDEACRNEPEHDKAFCVNGGWRIRAQTWDAVPQRKRHNDFATKDEVAAVITALSVEVADAVTAKVMKALEGREVSGTIVVADNDDASSLDNDHHPSSSRSMSSTPRPSQRPQSAAPYMLFPVEDWSWPPANLIGLRKMDHAKGWNRENDCLCCGGYHPFHKCKFYGRDARRKMFIEQRRCIRCLAFHPGRSCWKYAQLHLCGSTSCSDEHHHGFCSAGQVRYDPRIK